MIGHHGIADAQEINQCPAAVTAGKDLSSRSGGFSNCLHDSPCRVIVLERELQALWRTPSQIHPNTRFSSKPEDKESGLAYFGTRYYDPILGRLMGIDPVAPNPENSHSLNRYACANNNPYKFVDPDGHDPKSF